MANITLRWVDTHLFKRFIQLFVDVSRDERIPVAVRTEVKDKVNDILLASMDAKEPESNLRRDVELVGEEKGWAIHGYAEKEKD